ncbi:hypothetical protein VTN02DRAFT_4452 [Thermoascus thermophilus]
MKIGHILNQYLHRIWDLMSSVMGLWVPAMSTSRAWKLTLPQQAGSRTALMKERRNSKGLGSWFPENRIMALALS